LFKPIGHHLDGDLVWDQVAGIHIAFGQTAQLGLAFQIVPEEISGSRLGQSGCLLEELCLRAFACPWHAEQHNIRSCLGHLGSPGACRSSRVKDEEDRGLHLRPFPCSVSTTSNLAGGSADKSFVVAHHQLGFDLLHGIQHHTDHDEHA
jgi:hypothetical protein